MVDYSKWKNIDISDDEEELDPSIDAPSLFKWRHQTRLAREADMRKQREELKQQKQQNAAKQQKLRQSLNNISGAGGGGGVSSSEEIQLRRELTRLEREREMLERAEHDLTDREGRMPWTVDTISKPGFEKTVINRQPSIGYAQRGKDLSEAEREQSLRQFVDKHESLCKQYGMLRRYEDSMRFLQRQPVILCEHTSSYLVLWAITLEVEQQHELVGYVAHQCICLQYILELSRQLNLDPRGCVTTFFVKIQRCVPEYREQFVSEIESFKERIKQRAQAKIDETRAHMIEMERKARLGPGGLDPFEVFDSLPDELKICFEKQDISLLQKTILSMKTDVALNHIKRCIDAGIWVPCNDSRRKETISGNTPVGQSQNVAAVVTELMEATVIQELPKVASVADDLPKVATVMAALKESATVVAEMNEEASGGELELEESDVGEADEQSSVATGDDLEQTSMHSKIQHCAKNQIYYSRSENDIKQLKNTSKANKPQRKVSSERNGGEEEEHVTTLLFETDLERSKSFDVEVNTNKEQINSSFDQEAQKTETSLPSSESYEGNSDANSKVIEEHDKCSEVSTNNNIEEGSSDELQDVEERSETEERLKKELEVNIKEDEVNVHSEAGDERNDRDEEEWTESEGTRHSETTKENNDNDDDRQNILAEEQTNESEENDQLEMLKDDKYQDNEEKRLSNEREKDEWPGTKNENMSKEFEENALTKMSNELSITEKQPETDQDVTNKENEDNELSEPTEDHSEMGEQTENTEQNEQQCDTEVASSSNAIVGKSASDENIEVFDTLYIVRKRAKPQKESETVHNKILRPEPADEETQNKLAKILEIIDELEDDENSCRVSFPKVYEIENEFPSMKRQNTKHNLLATSETSLKHFQSDTQLSNASDYSRENDNNEASPS